MKAHELMASVGLGMGVPVEPVQSAPRPELGLPARPVGSRLGPIRAGIREAPADLSRAPFMVIWETTRACDLACVHCRAKADSTGEPDQLSPEEGEKLLRDISGFGDPKPLVILTGGDPFKRPDVFHLAQFGRSLGLNMAVSPAGTPQLTFSNLAQLKRAGASSISLSLDGSTPAAHDDFRGVPGVFDKTIAGWGFCRALKLDVQINTTVTRRNLLDLPNIFHLLQSKGAMTWSLFFLVPTGRAKKSDDLSGQEYEDVLNFLYDCSKYISAKHTEGHHFKRVVLQRRAAETNEELKGIRPPVGPTYQTLRQEMDRIVRDAGIAPRKEGVVRPPLNINAGKGFVFISSTGEVYPSGFLPFKVGSVRKGSIVSLYRDEPILRDLRDPNKLKGKCGKCNFREICGGSRSRAYAYTGDPFAAEPRCIYQPMEA